MDFLDIVMELRKQHGIDVPEAEYRELESLTVRPTICCPSSSRRQPNLVPPAPSRLPAIPNQASEHHDVIVIGAGLSGLAAALRLAMFGKKVILLEKHYVVGGLNSFYAKKGIKFDVGLHALTNYPSLNSGKSSPLLKLCRQLRISLDSLNLLQQSHSRISFGSKSLLFDNNFDFFVSQIEDKFPGERDRFQSLLEK